MHNFVLFFNTIYNFLLSFLWSSCYPYLEYSLSFLPVEIISILQEIAPALNIKKKNTIDFLNTYELLLFLCIGFQQKFFWS